MRCSFYIFHVVDSKPEHTNELIHESSPYLIQHAHNPVDWLPWGEKALEKAKNENRLLIISIGYSSCHWCHVMERESFENHDVARIMNMDYVSVKVDREERPDVDMVYMNAAHLITGSGGWPLNAIALPDGRPVYAGTYFPRENWLRLLEHFTELYRDQPELLEEQAQKLVQGLVKMEEIPVIDNPRPFTQIDVSGFTQKLLDSIDFEKGGTYGSPKFPMPVIFEYLLHYHALTGNKTVLEAVDTTLVQMANGGIYDQLGGGFARYSVDDKWFAPHFEKMLYDNAQLISLYSKAYRVTGNPLYKSVVYESMEFIERELLAPGGGFYSALDADSEGGEGRFYTWTSKEVNEILQDEAGLFSEYYNISEEGNWEAGTNILYVSNEVSSRPDNLKSWKKTMLETRSSRARPGLDNKVLTSWNALMLSACIDSFRAFGEARFLDSALKNARFIAGEMVQDDNSIMRNYMNDHASINGFLDDYAFTAGAFINLYQVTFDEKWLITARRLVQYALHHFYDSNTGTFYYKSDRDKPLISQSRELSDNVIPSSNSEMAKNLFFLGTFFEIKDYIVKATRIAGVMKEKITRHPSFHANWGQLILHLADPPYEVAILGKEAILKRQEFDREYLPQVIFAGGEKEGNLGMLQGRLLKDKTLIYVCKNKACQLPVSDVVKALKQITGH